MRAVVLLSGGLDSSTALAIARAKDRECFTLSVHYGQRNLAELRAAQKISAKLGAARHESLEFPLSCLFSSSSLTNTGISVPVDKIKKNKLSPNTYVPARNTILLSLALGWAETLNASEIHFGANSIDYPGYPDCRLEYIEAFEKMAKLAIQNNKPESSSIKICVPLIHMTKAQIIIEGTRLGVDYSETISCYQADDLGQACGMCYACQFRKEGFIAAGIPDPTIYA